jgi:hypothetical protein
MKGKRSRIHMIGLEAPDKNSSPQGADALVESLLSRKGAMTSKQRNLAWVFLWFLIPFGVLLLFWALRIRPIYVEEQFSEIATSARMFHPNFLGWFIRPFSLYRMDYPQWNTQYRSFIRPTECLNYFIMSVLFGTNYTAYLVSNYFYQAGTCAFAFYIAAENLKLDRKLAHVIAFLVFVSPAYGQQQTFLISFAVDPMAGFFALASVAFFLGRKFFIAWVLVVLAVGAKEPAWAFPIVMAVLYFFCQKDRLLRRTSISLAFLSPLIGILALRTYAFGLAGALTSDQGRAAPTIVTSGAFAQLGNVLRVMLAFAKWPLGVLTASQQYDPRILSFFSYWGFVFDVVFWTCLLAFIVRAFRRWRSQSPGGHTFRDAGRSLYSRYGFAICSTFLFAAGSLIFPLRFTSDPRYGASTYPLIFLCAAIVLARRPDRVARALCLVTLVSIGAYGAVFRISDATKGRDIFRAEWELVAGYREAIQAAGTHPLFIIDDATGGEINSEAIQKFYGPQVKVVRLNDLFKDRSCLLMPDHGELPLHLQVSARRIASHSIVVQSEITGCGGHNFLGAPQLPDGPLEREDQGFRMSYQLDPISSPQPTSGKPRELQVTIENAPLDSVIVAPNFSRRTYDVVPIVDDPSGV